ncbi:hypothetical protein GCM10025865_28200 [Paraoerskovia sediminicola]|uniref:Uncharacterized protein n=1 Tax=Paraoerskovia sediminicola TaxID=1138587 RepID=A0ABM8G5W6_9CELL|nr:hypothetical protein [Paraoerskovia sediminicola]BDZ43521.1 hypothetical protein GCM10025865_28200 [Paraoerskovia sediminicola]
MTVTVATEYPHPEGLYATSQGSFQETPSGDVLVGWGAIPRWSRMSDTGELLSDSGWDDDLVVTSYRFQQREWTGDPLEGPSAVATQDGDSVVVHASWNGATEVDAWRLRDGDVEVTTGRTGFETRIEWQSGAPEGDGGDPDGEPRPSQALVQALGSAGEVLGTTTVTLP